MKSAAIRQKFLDFFASKGHQKVASSSLVPGNDPTLLFTNAGMVQFKDVFLGFDQRPYTRAVSSQRCVRAGGKHNDLENVGYTARHHTFFEMLGNFSFGDYFKRDAILFAWEFLTDPAWMGLPKEKLWVTVYATDDEAFNYWRDLVGIPEARIIRIGDNKGAPYASDNFWQMGDTGPCGPCTEIFYDHGEAIFGGPPGSPDEDGDRYIEIWNNVFMQFNRDESGTLHPLPKPSVDTGMGLERISAVLQHVHSNYEIDLFQHLIQGAARETHTADLNSPSLKVIADHIRACSFLIVDGVLPGNEGRGYVVRRIARRAMRHGHKLGQKGLFFHKIVADLVEIMGEAYPELREKQTHIEAVLKQEEEQFARTLENGMGLLLTALEHVVDVKNPQPIREGSTDTPQLSGEVAFTLYDTYGFPADLTADVCREYGAVVNETEFDACMETARTRSRATSSFKMSGQLDYSGENTHFDGYTGLESSGRIVALFKDKQAVTQLHAGETGVVILDRTAFYAESGGQAGDTGTLSNGSSVFQVLDTQKVLAAVFGHQGRVKSGSLTVGDQLDAQVDRVVRQATERNHSATHLLHAALRQVLGTHVSQKGSLVNAERTRFDFAHTQALSAAEIANIEQRVNHVILSNYPVTATNMSFDDAVASGAMALFGEKYGDEVRVLKMGEFSTELCGGTHVSRTGDIGLFKIIVEGGVAAGIRRIEALTGTAALAWIQTQEAQLKDAAGLLKAQPSELASRIAQNQEHVKALEKEVSRLKSKLAASQGDELAAQAQVAANGIPYLTVQLEGADSGTLRDLLDQLKNKLGSAAIVIGSVVDGKVALIAGVTADLTARVKAGELVNLVAQQVGGKGGGRPDMAQAGGTEPAHLTHALASVADWIAAK